MKKMVLVFGAVAAAAALMTGCAGVGSYNGSPNVAYGYPNFFSQVSGNAMIQPISTEFKVVKNNVSASAEMTSFFSCVCMGDASYDTLKKEALKGLDADELTNVRIDYKMNNVLGINKVTVTLSGTAIKLK